MAKKRFKAEQIVLMLWGGAQLAKGLSIEEISRNRGITSQSY